MSAAVLAPAPKTVRFPSEEAINEYMKTHPMSITGIAVNLYVPKLFEFLANYFRNKEIPLNDLKKEVEIAVDAAIDKNGNEDQQKLNGLRKGLGKFNASMKERDIVDFEMQRIEIESIPPHLKATLAVCEKMMEDVLERATFTPPKDDSGKWTKNKVVQLDDKKSDV